jgi:hypothetical protein
MPEMRLTERTGKQLLSLRSIEDAVRGNLIRYPEFISFVFWSLFGGPRRHPYSQRAYAEADR